MARHGFAVSLTAAVAFLFLLLVYLPNGSHIGSLIPVVFRLAGGTRLFPTLCSHQTPVLPSSNQDGAAYLLGVGKADITG